MDKVKGGGEAEEGREWWNWQRRWTGNKAGGRGGGQPCGRARRRVERQGNNEEERSDPSTGLAGSTLSEVPGSISMRGTIWSSIQALSRSLQFITA
jgi:hypothetical protein